MKEESVIAQFHSLMDDYKNAEENEKFGAIEKAKKCARDCIEQVRAKCEMQAIDGPSTVVGTMRLQLLTRMFKCHSVQCLPSFWMQWKDLSLMKTEMGPWSSC